MYPPVGLSTAGGQAIERLSHACSMATICGSLRPPRPRLLHGLKSTSDLSGPFARRCSPFSHENEVSCGRVSLICTASCRTIDGGAARRFERISHACSMATICGSLRPPRPRLLHGLKSTSDLSGPFAPRCSPFSSIVVPVATGMGDCYENSARPPRHVVLRSPRRRTWGGVGLDHANRRHHFHPLMWPSQGHGHSGESRNLGVGPSYEDNASHVVDGPSWEVIQRSPFGGEDCDGGSSARWRRLRLCLTINEQLRRP